MINNLDIKSKKGSKVELPQYLSNLPEVVDEKAINLYRYVYLSNQREANASVKTKAQVRGGGRKPYSQKGTGRARAGSIRSPIWTGGGRAHGPKSIVNFNLKLNKKFRAYVLKNLLKSKLESGELTLITNLDSAFSDKPSVKFAVEISKDLELGGKSIIVLSQNNDTLVKSFNTARKSTPHVKLASEVSIYELMNTKHIYISSDDNTTNWMMKRISY